MTTEEERRHYDLQLGKVTASVVSLKEAFEDFRGEQRGHNASVIDRLDNKVNGKIETQSQAIVRNSEAIVALLTDMAHVKQQTPMQLPAPMPGMKTIVEVTDVDTKAITRREAQIVIATIGATVSIITFFVWAWPLLQKAFSQ